MIRSLLLLCLVTAVPSAAQGINSAVVLEVVWSDALTGAEVASGAILEALANDSLAMAEPEAARAAAFRRELVVASHAAASSAGSLTAAFQLEVGLADPAVQDSVEASLGETVTALYYALAGVVDEAADVAESASPPTAERRAAWRRWAMIVQQTVGIVRDAQAQGSR